jgi:ribonuclease HI
MMITRNKKCTWTFGHCEHATNNAMEHVIEALRVLPEGLHVWITGNWKTGNRTPVANRSLWQELIEFSMKHTRI